MPNRPTLATTDALRAVDRLERRIRNLKPTGSAAKLIHEGFAEIRERILELGELEALTRQEDLKTEHSSSLIDKGLKTWGLHNAIDLARDKLGDAWDAMRDLIDYWIN